MNEELYQKDLDKAWYLVGYPNGASSILQGISNARMRSDGGLATSRSCGYVSEDVLRIREKISDEPCRECGSIVATNYTNGEEMRRDNICFTCWFWRRLYAKKDDPKTVRVKGVHYQIGEGRGPAEFRGHGGSRFKIRFHDGREAETTDLWCQGNIAPPWKDRLPDNAEFVNSNS